ncbi:MAG: ATP synthase F0 subunit B [Acidimicrobiales bacterium]
MWILASEAPNGNWLPGDVNEFIWASLAFLVVLAIGLWKGLGPIKAALAGRTERIRDELAAADNAKAEADARRTEQLAKLGDADAEARQIVVDAESRATTMRADLMAKAETDVEATKAKARLDIDVAKGAALADIRAEAAANAAAAAEAVVTQNLDDARLGALIDSYITEVGA